VDHGLPLSGRVLKEFQSRFPSLEMCDDWNWDQLWARLRRLHFDEAEAQGWLDAVVYTAELHPRRIKVIDYWLLYWASQWPKDQPALYPPFEEWRCEAESYVPNGCDPEGASSVPLQG
jgi:hypothetical protein